MTTRKEGQVTLYDDAEETSYPYEITVLPTTPSPNSIVDQAGKTVTQRDLTQLQKHLKWLKERLEQLGTATNTPTYTEELAHLTDKLQKLALTLNPHPADRPLGEHIHTEMQQYTDTLCAAQW